MYRIIECWLYVYLHEFMGKLLYKWKKLCIMMLYTNKTLLLLDNILLRRRRGVFCLLPEKTWNPYILYLLTPLYGSHTNLECKVCNKLQKLCGKASTPSSFAGFFFWCVSGHYEFRTNECTRNENSIRVIKIGRKGRARAYRYFGAEYTILGDRVRPLTVSRRLCHRAPVHSRWPRREVIHMRARRIFFKQIPHTARGHKIR